MSDVSRRAAEARDLLGPIGEVRRVPALATVFQDDETGDWVVSARDGGGSGIHITVFNGPRAQERALEYAEEKYSGVRLTAPHRPQPH